MIKLRLFLMSALMMLLAVATAAAQAPADTTTTGGRGDTWFIPGDVAFAVAIAAFGGALADGRAISAACEGTARNPGAGGRIFNMLILGLALIETLVLFTFLTLFLRPNR
ncbi:MAG TPA: ATP synthase F0 subunit C [Blastocatellia bacterium]|nr:ATP synthase F0 subunit C [Blastocatellia bacterium]